MAKKPIDRSKVPPDMLEAARKQALAKQARMMAEAELGISDDNIPVQKGPLGDEGPDVDVYVNLADFADRIVIDGTIYIHGRTYTIPEKKAAVVMEACARGWRHQAEIEGKDHSNFYLQQQVQNTAIRLSPKAGVARVAI